MKDLTFRLRTKTREVTILNEKEEESKYEIRELTAAVREKYMDALSRRLVLDKKGNVIGLTKYEGMQMDLLTICMRDEDGKPVTRQMLDQWPSSTVTELFHAAQCINGLRKEDTRDSLVAEQIVKFLKEAKAFEDITAEEIEEVIDKTDKNLYAEKQPDAEEETTTAG
jgi:hypothetical protein